MRIPLPVLIYMGSRSYNYYNPNPAHDPWQSGPPPLVMARILGTFRSQHMAPRRVALILPTRLLCTHRSVVLPPW